MKREFLQSLQVGDMTLPKELVDAIMEEHGKSVQKAKAWQDKYEQAVLDHQAALEQLRFDHLLDRAITQARGRNVKAITALLDVEALRAAGSQEAVDKALEDLRREQGYLFADSAPPYAPGTGMQVPLQPQRPATLAGALRERFEQKR